MLKQLNKIDNQEDDISTEELSLDDEETKFIDGIETDSDVELKVLLKFGYIVDVKGNKEIRFELGTNKEIDRGLVAGLTQNNKIVDAYFLGNNISKDKNIFFNENIIEANGKKYEYSDLRIHMTSNSACIVSKEENDLITRLDDDAYQMFSSVMGNNSDNTCVISVINSKICACCLSDGEILWAHPINIGKNKFNEETGDIKTKSGKFNLSDCYLRTCMKNIYLHIDIEKPPSTLIIGNVDNPFYKIENNNIHC